MSPDLNRIINKIYVLTIGRNSDRHESVDSILENLKFEYWYGFDTRVNFPKIKYVSELGEEFFIENDVDKNHASRFTIGQLGAYLSIKKMIDYIAFSGFEKVLIFEDDILNLKKDWKHILSNAIEELPDDWDILLVGYNYDGTLYHFSYNRNMRYLVKAWNTFKYLIKNKNSIKRLPVKFSNHLDISGFSMGGHAYCISKKGAALLSSNLSPMRDSGDILISNLISEKKIKAFSVYPCLFMQNKKFGSKTNIN